MIEIRVRCKVASEPTNTAFVVCNNTDYTISFDFDAEWDAYSVKTARFIWNCQYRDVVFSGTECTAPAIDDASVVAIGVFAGELRTTTPALIPCRRSILDGDGIPAPPSDDVYAQIMELLNDIETYKLTPVEKTDEMTQEVGRDAEGKLYTKSGSGSGGTADHRQLEHRDAANQHPISAIEGLTDALAGKQPTGNYLTSETDPAFSASAAALITSENISAWNGKYSKPSGGIPKSDLATAVQTSLGKADSALQQSSLNGYATETYVDNAVGVVQDDVDAIVEVIPSQASSQNQLADKNFVNSTVGTNAAYYISNNGEPFTSLAQLLAYSGTITNNDYAFVIGTDSAGNTTYTRYKYNSNTQQWAEEYVLNNSSFTSAQWAAISSGITALLVQSYNEHIADNDIHVTTNDKSAWNGKQSAIPDLETIRTGAAAGATAVQPEDLPDYPETEEATEIAYTTVAMEVTYTDDTTETLNVMVVLDDD